MKLKICITIIMLMGLVALISDTLEVSLDGTKPYTVIQLAIDEAVFGDTVLIYPGHYYENLDLANRSGLTICSLEAITGDETYITSTIIDGSQNESSTIACYENTTDCIIQGLAITGGSGFRYSELETHVFGGGLYIHFNCSLTLKNLDVYSNKAVWGGGILISHSSEVLLENVNIHNNIAIWRGGGLCISYEHNVDYGITFSQTNRCSIYDNFAQWGMDIYWHAQMSDQGEIYLKKFTKSSYDKYFADWFVFNENLNPDACPYTVFDVEESYLEEVDADLYVSPEGNDNNSGLTSTQPLKTPAMAMQRILANPDSPNTVHLLEGTHHNIINDTYMPICVKNHTSLQGTSTSDTELYCQNLIVSTAAISFINAGQSPTIRDFSITTNMASAVWALDVFDLRVENIVIEDSVVEQLMFFVGSVENTMLLKDLKFKNIHALYNRFGPTLRGSDIVIDNLTIENCYNDHVINDVEWDNNCGALDVMSSGSFVMKNSSIINNVCDTTAGFSLARVWAFNEDYDTDVVIDNCLIANNEIIGGGVIFVTNSDETDFSNNTIVNNLSNVVATVHLGYDASVRNSIFDNPDSRDLMYGGELYLENNLFTKPENGNVFATWEESDMVINEGNIFGQDPLFMGGDPATKDYYSLCADDENGYSPAIDSGLENSQYIFNAEPLAEFDLWGNPRIHGGSIDIGCFESPGYTDNSEDVIETITGLHATNYPNPFNPETTIIFNNPKSGMIKLAIYNIKGQLVNSLVNQKLDAGVHNIVWNGKDSNSKSVASGVYFYKIVSGNNNVTKKMILMK